MVQRQHQIDLDDLIGMCRSEVAKTALAESIACFQAGAYRAAIVSTWTAVVYDYLDKLRELEIAGNGEARIILAQFETAREKNDTQKLLSLEREALEKASTTFELLSPIERQDLERLELDRHRCAHPSFLAPEAPYRPSAELVRSHMRSAVTHLLGQPPLQGKEAWKRIWAEIQSPYFPESIETATARLRARIPKARETLVNQIVVELTKSVLSPATDANSRSRYYAGLVAVTRIYNPESVAILRRKLTKLADEVEDPSLELLLQYASQIQFAWEHLGVNVQERLSAYVTQTDQVNAIHLSLQITPLLPTIYQRIGTLEDQILVATVRSSSDNQCRSEIVRRLESGKEYSSFARLRRGLTVGETGVPWTVELLNRLAEVLILNEAFYKYMGFGGAATEILELSGQTVLKYEDKWRQIYDRLIAGRHLKAADAVQNRFPSFPPPAARSADPEDDVL